MSAGKKAVIAIAGNPNSGKTTLFNALTGLHQRVGNWPGVTVEKKTGSLEVGDTLIEVVDLPGIYSLSSYSEDEKIAGIISFPMKPVWSSISSTRRIWNEISFSP
jgi:ferrous iron transport protein B